MEAPRPIHQNNFFPRPQAKHPPGMPGVRFLQAGYFPLKAGIIHKKAVHQAGLLLIIATHSPFLRSSTSS